MGKAELLNDVLDAMRSLSSNLQAVEDIARDMNWLANNLQIFFQDAETEPWQKQHETNKEIISTISKRPQVNIGTKPPTQKPLTLEAVRAVLAEKSRNGHTAKIRELLEKHGAAKLSEIDPQKYSALLAEAEVLGNG